MSPHIDLATRPVREKLGELSAIDSILLADKIHPFKNPLKGVKNV